MDNHLSDYPVEVACEGKSIFCGVHLSQQKMRLKRNLIVEFPFISLMDYFKTLLLITIIPDKFCLSRKVILCNLFCNVAHGKRFSNCCFVSEVASGFYTAYSHFLLWLFYIDVLLYLSDRSIHYFYIRFSI